MTENRNPAVPKTINAGDKVVEFFVSKANLGREEAVECEGKWKAFLNTHAAIENTKYKAGQILEELRNKLLEDRLWVQFLKEVRFPRTTAKAYLDCVSVVDKTIPSAALRKILVQYADPAKKRVLTAAAAVLKEHPSATPQQQAARIIEISSRPLPKQAQTKAFKDLMRAAYKSLVALKSLKDAAGVPRNFNLPRSFGMVVLSAAHTLEIAKADLPTSEPAKGDEWLTSKTPLADMEINPYDLSTGTEG